MKMQGAVVLGPMPDEYARLLEDVMRVAAMHAAIHLMLVMEGGPERLFDRRAVALLLYALLGIAIYHLILHRIVEVRRSDGRRVSPTTS